MADPVGRFNIAFDAGALEWDVTWTRLDDTDGLVTSWTVDRGRMFELDRTDGARATVEISDRDGILDPTNPTGPYYGLIEPLLQAVICRRDPVAEQWQPRFRGWISDFTYDFDPSQQVNRLTLELVDIFEILSTIEMTPLEFGHDPLDETPANTDAVGQVWFTSQTMEDRIQGVLTNAGIPADFFVVFSGNVRVIAWPYSVGESPMTVIQEAADSEFPGVSNVFSDRFGRLAVHGRNAKFDPAGVVAGLGDPTDWDWHQWLAGDGAAVAADLGNVAQIRRFAFNRGLSKIINSAVATPMGIDDADVADQLLQDATSIGRFGIRSWSAQNLLTEEGLVDSSTPLVETKRFAQFYVTNYSNPENRVTQISFRSMLPGAAGSNKTWQLMSRSDIADKVTITVASPGGGGFEDQSFYVEGIHETSRPLNPDYDDDTVEFDLSPVAYFTTYDMFPPEE